MMNRPQRRSVAILILLTVIVVLGVYALLVSGVLANLFDPDPEATSSAVTPQASTLGP
jgi:ABC-type lipoprotein release transport system permease subunit